MTQHIPSFSSKKAKDRKVLAIVLAILLHILIGLTIYFTLFDHKESEVISLTDEPVAVSKLKKSSPITTSPKENPISLSNHSQENNSLTDTANKTTADTKNKPPSKNPLPTITPIKSSTIQSTTQKDAQDRKIKALKTNDTGSVIDNQETDDNYKLQPNQAYQQLDADIEKESEQLSKLIDEVKQRNQSQIQQHQAHKTTPRNNDDTSVSKPDHPITPINSLATERPTANE